MITSDAFLAIEKALTQRLLKALSRITGEIYPKVDAALASGDLTRAHELLASMSLASIRDEEFDQILFLTNAAMLFGASRVTQQPGTSVVGMGFEALTANQMASHFLQMICQKAESYLFMAGSAFIFPPVKKAEGDSGGAGRVLHPFASFMDSAGKAYFNIASSLHTSRVSAYGFTAEAKVLGLEEYQISEQLDTRTCPVCRLMHGKKFKVDDARKLLQVVTRTVDPDDLKSLQPWPKQDQVNLDAMASMSPDELVAKGWHTPPFHPRCRGLLTRVGKVPSLESVAAGTFQEKYVTTKADFDFLGSPVSAPGVKLWNKVSQVSPTEVVARLSGAPVDEFLAEMIGAEDPKKQPGLVSLSVGRNVSVSLSKPVFGSQSPVDQTVKVLPSGNVVLEKLTLHDEPEGAKVFKSYMRELYALSKDMGAKNLEVHASGASWARFGFKPSMKQWDLLKADIQERYVALGYGESHSALQAKAYQAVMASNDPAYIYTLSDLSFGSALLDGLSWAGALDMADEEAVVRFLTFLGDL